MDNTEKLVQSILKAWKYAVQNALDATVDQIDELGKLVVTATTEEELSLIGDVQDILYDSIDFGTVQTELRNLLEKRR